MPIVPCRLIFAIPWPTGKGSFNTSTLVSAPHFLSCQRQPRAPTSWSRGISTQPCEVCWARTDPEKQTSSWVVLLPQPPHGQVQGTQNRAHRRDGRQWAWVAAWEMLIRPKENLFHQEGNHHNKSVLAGTQNSSGEGPELIHPHWLWFEQEVGADMPQRSLPTSVTAWFCE